MGKREKNFIIDKKGYRIMYKSFFKTVLVFVVFIFFPFYIGKIINYMSSGHLDNVLITWFTGLMAVVIVGGIVYALGMLFLLVWMYFEDLT